MKRTTAALAAFALAAAVTLPAAGATMKLADRDLWQEAKARVVNDTTYVSLRTVTEYLAPQARVSWADGAAAVEGAGLSLRAVPGEQWLTVNDRAFYIPGGVQADGGSILVPIRVLTRALGGSVDWSRETGITLTAGAGRPDAPDYTQEDLYWLARIISAESRGEPLLGKLAVGTVVLNRVADAQFPDTIYDVIFDRKWGVQFTPTANGTIYDEPTEESILAAKLVLDGARAAGNSLYFFAPELTEDRWISENREHVTTIGCHWFYR